MAKKRKTVTKATRGTTKPKTPPDTPLTKQLKTLAALGLKLNEGVTELDIQKLIKQRGEEEYLEFPFEFLIDTFAQVVRKGRSWRKVSNDVLGFDRECIYGQGDYSSLVESLATFAGLSKHFTDITDVIETKPPSSVKNASKATVTVNYKVFGKHRKIRTAVDSDWVDPAALRKIMSDLSKRDKEIYFLEQGQALILLSLTPKSATKLNSLTGGLITSYRKLN